MPQFLSPIGNDQFIDANGDPLTGGQVETYLNGSSTPAATYTSSSGATPQPNPIILNSLGYAPSPVWLTGGIAYKFVIKDASGSTLRTIDDISGVNDASVSQSEWVESGFVPTYISATSFSVPGDQTPILQIGRRLRTTNTSGLVYSTISNSVFAAGITTITLTNDSATLDAGLTLVAYALLAASPVSVPSLAGSKITGAYTASAMTLATTRVLGRLTAASGPAEELTSTQVTASFVDAATTALPGKIELATSAEAITGTDATRAITPSTMKAAQIVLGTAVTASGTAIDFTGIPSYANRVTVMFDRISTNGSSTPILQLGAGAISNTAYQGTSVRFQNGVSPDLISISTGFAINGAAAANTLHGTLTLERMTGNTWSCTGVLGCTGNAFQFTVAGQKAVAGVLDRIRLTTSGGADTFDDGTLNISWE